MGLLSKIIAIIVSRSSHAFPRWTVSLGKCIYCLCFVFFLDTVVINITLIFEHTCKILIFILLGKKDKLRVYYLSWLRNKILHNDPEVEKKQGWTTVGDLEGCVHYKVGECSALQRPIRVGFKSLGRCPGACRLFPSSPLRLVIVCWEGLRSH